MKTVTGQGTVHATGEELEKARIASAMTPGAPAVSDWKDTLPAEPKTEALAEGEKLELDEIYMKIVECPREQWPALVRQYAAGDAGMEQTLWGLLGVETPGGSGALLAPDGRVGGRYRLIKKIGTGASAVVWHAFDEELSRDVALKIFTTGGASDSMIRAVIREAQSSSRIVSDYVVRVYNTFIDQARGLAAIEMELCREISDEDGSEQNGQELATWVAPEGVINEAGARRAARWVLEASMGVRDGHRQGIFHRDLKPANILVRPVSLRAQVVDFGLAPRPMIRSAGENDERWIARQSMTVDMGGGGGRIAGTPAYMAPEQAAGLSWLDISRDVDRKVLVSIDVYGLGAVLFELLTGKAPHEREANNDPQAVLSRARENKVPLELLRRRPAPARLTKLVTRALATKPDDRYPTVDALAADLEAFLANRPMAHEQAKPLKRAYLAGKRNPSLVSAVSGLLLLLGMSGYSYQLGRNLIQTKNDLIQTKNDLIQTKNDYDEVLTRLTGLKELSDKDKKALSAATNETGQLRALVYSQKESIDKITKEKEGLDNQLKGKDKEIDKLTKEKEGLDNQLKGKDKEIDRLTKEKEGLDNQLKRKDKEIDRLTKEDQLAKTQNQQKLVETPSSVASLPPPPTGTPSAPPSPPPTGTPSAPPSPPPTASQSSAIVGTDGRAEFARP